MSITGIWIYDSNDRRLLPLMKESLHIIYSAYIYEKGMCVEFEYFFYEVRHDNKKKNSVKEKQLNNSLDYGSEINKYIYVYFDNVVPLITNKIKASNNIRYNIHLKWNIFIISYFC